MEEVKEAVNQVEKEMGKVFGDPNNTLLFSVRSGAAMSMPGMMDTVLNVGLNDVVVEGLAKQVNARFAWDCYRRLLQVGVLAACCWYLVFCALRSSVCSCACSPMLVIMDADDLGLLIFTSALLQYRAVYLQSTGPFTCRGPAYGNGYSPLSVQLCWDVRTGNTLSTRTSSANSPLSICCCSLLLHKYSAALF